MSLNTQIQMNANDIDQLLEKEKQRNKGDVWIKLDKTMRREKLHEYAEKYGNEHNMSSKDIKQLITFFNNCLERNRLNKARDVNYNKEDRVIISIPALHFNQVTKNFTLKIMDSKRVSTLKSLTPKKHKSIAEKDDKEESPRVSKEKVE